MGKLNFVLLATLISFSILSTTVLAQLPIVSPADPLILNFLTDTLKIPSEWNTLDKIVFNLIVPFLGIFLIVAGFLKALRIFGDAGGIRLALASIIAFTTLPTGLFLIAVSWLLSVAGIWSVVVFFVLFVVGIALYSYGGLQKLYWPGQRAGELRKVHKGAIDSVKKDLEKLDQRIKTIHLQMEGALNDYNMDKYNTLKDEREKLTQRRRELISQLKEIRSAKV